MGHTYYAVYEHIVFSTKGRARVLTPEIRSEVHRYLAAAVDGQGCRCLAAGGEIDHVHLLVQKGSTVLTPDLVKEIKRTSSLWIKTKRKALRRFYWQEGFGAFSVSYSNLGKVKGYIAHQEKHHATKTWEDEFRGMLVRSGIEFDERYFLD